jgi:Fe-S-cluster-containing dehydrogenase component
MARLGMVIDLETCVGCQSCTIACKSSNGTPPDIFFSQVHEREVGEYPNSRREFLPTLCNHCDDAPCVEVCPTGASFQREDGIVGVNPDICIGCKSCDMACPYGHRHYVQPGLLKSGYYESELTEYEEVKYERWTEGTVIKCDFCMDRIDQNLDPACVATCPPISRHFGDLSDPESNVSRLLENRESFTLAPEAGTKPNVHYLKSTKS